MVDLATPVALQKIEHDHIANLSNLVLGVAGYGQLVRLHQKEDATNYANIFGNRDTTNGRAVTIQYGDPLSPTVLATFQKSATRIQSADGTKAIEISNDGVEITGGFEFGGEISGSSLSVTGAVGGATLSLSGAASVNSLAVTNAATAGSLSVSGATSTGSLSVAGTSALASLTVGGFTVLGGRGFRVYNVLDYGIVAGSTSASAAANTTALQTLWTTVTNSGGDGGGTVYFPPGRYPFNATALNHNVPGLAPAINVLGSGQETFIDLYGTSGPFWDIAGNANSRVARGVIRDLRFVHKGNVSSGASIRLGAVTYYQLENLTVETGDGTDATAAFGCLTIGNGSLTTNNIDVERCVFQNAQNKASAPIIEITGSTAAGVHIRRCTIQGGGDTGYTNNNSIGILFSNTGAFDTLKVIDTGIATCKYGIIAPAVSLANMMLSNVYFDAIATTALSLGTTSGKTIRNVQAENCWFNSNVISVALERAGGTLETLQFSNCYFTEGDSGSFTADEITGLIVNGCLFVSTADGTPILAITDAALGVVVANNFFWDLNAATYSYSIASGADGVVVTGNVSNGVTGNFGPTPDSGRVHANNAEV